MRVEPSPRVLVTAGGLGSLLVAASSYWVGATPIRFRTDPPAVVDVMRQGALPASIAWYLGVAVIGLAWLALGRRVLDQRNQNDASVDVRTLRVAGVATAVPMLVAVPLMSRDLWSYATQARIAAAGLDPYSVTPTQFGDVSVPNVSGRWVDSASPYGPLWTVLGRGIAHLTGDHLLLQVLVLRLPEVLGFALLAWVIPELARRVGTSAERATWLVVASPMVVLHGVGGGHNDVLMIGLLAAALRVAVGSGPRWRTLLLAGLLVGAAASIKIPAVIAAPFLPLLWARYANEKPSRTADPITGAALALAGAAVALALSTLAAGQGLAWFGAANTTEHGGGPVAIAVLAVVLVVLWLVALRTSPVLLLAAALFAPLWISDLSLAWYWFWPLVPLVLVARGRPLIALLAAGELVEVLFARPKGPNLAVWPYLVVIVVVVGAVTWLLLAPRATAPASQQVDDELSRSSKT